MEAGGRGGEGVGKLVKSGGACGRLPACGLRDAPGPAAVCLRLSASLPFPLPRPGADPGPGRREGSGGIGAC